jgi:trimeric autotransporter adhesin
MTAIDKYILRTTLSLAMVTLSLTVSAQTTASIKTVKVTPETAEAEVGQQLQFACQALDAEGKPVDTKTIYWIAIPSDHAAADNSGKVTFFASGEIRVIALVAGKPGLAKVNVKPARVTRIDVTRLNAPLVVGGTIKLNAKAIGSNGDPREDVTFSWSSESSSVAVVDAAGLVTGVAPGKAKLVAKADGASGELTIEVVNTPVRSVAIEPRTAAARAGDVIRFSAQAKDAGGKAIKDAVVRWAVSGEGATVEGDGGFVAERPGSYVVSATVGAQSAVATVVIAPRNVERSLEMVGRISLKDLQTAEQLCRVRCRPLRLK